MKQQLAETLLARVMDWSDEEKAKERAVLETFAIYKYDFYQQYAPGRRFIESLASWLGQFDPGDERRRAYRFVREKIIFISTQEMVALVDQVNPRHIRPKLLLDSGRASGIDVHRVRHILESDEFWRRRRSTLVLGLSDGARTDWFRRANPSFSNEQVFHAYDVSLDKIEDMRSDLRRDIDEKLGTGAGDGKRFSYVYLLDDFSGSGTSFIRKEGEDWKGKIVKFLEKLEDEEKLGQAIDHTGVHVEVILYVASEQAISYIQNKVREVPFKRGVVHLSVVHRLRPDAVLDDEKDSGILGLAKQERYFDPAVDDEHAAKGKTSKRLGYADGRLPLVLEHNTPNNAIYLLWAEESDRNTGLFPRVSRHRPVG